jgi:nucleoid DNA-binding protein
VAVKNADLSGFAALVAALQIRLGCTRAEARELLELIADTVVRQALLRQTRVVWPRLGAFRAFTTKARTIDLEALKAHGHLHAEAPSAAEVPPMRKLRFRPSKWHALLKVSR